MLRPALPANGNLDGDGLPFISRLTVLSTIHCSAGFTLNTSEVYLSDIYHASTRVFAMLVMFQEVEEEEEEEEEDCEDWKSCRTKVDVEVVG